MSEIAFETATELARKIRAREVGCLELLDHFLARVDRLNPALNALIWLDPDGARERAREADAALARGEVWGPLHGVPMSIKESYDVAGSPTTWGVPAYRDNIATVDSLPVRRLKAAGVTLFGKTNVPLLLADWQSYNAIYGTTNNPWDTGRTPGGSSGGSAAALAAGLTGIDAGSDIGSSIRNPAHYCGLFGHKPTWGILSTQGHALPGSYAYADISVIGPLARGARDLEIAVDAMKGPDDLDSVGWRVELPAPRHTRLRDFRVAVMYDDPCSDVDDEVKEKIADLARFLAAEGAQVSETARPDIDTAKLHEIYVRLLRAATSGRMPDDEMAAQLAAVDGLDHADESYFARMVRANTIRHRDWHRSNNERHRMRRVWAEFFREWDVLLCPVAASAAFPHDQDGERWERTIEVNGRRVPTTDQLFWAGLNGVVLLPGTVAPLGPGSRSGLPIGVQIVTAHCEDRTSLAFARLLEEQYRAFEPPPGYG